MSKWPFGGWPVAPRPVGFEPIPEREAQVGRRFTRTAWQGLKFFLPLLRPFKWRIALICMLDLAGMIIAFIPPIYATIMIDRAFPNRDWTLAAQVVALLLLTELSLQGLAAIRNGFHVYHISRLQLELRLRSYAHLQRLSIGFAESAPVGQRVFRTRIDSDEVANVVVNFYPTLVRFIEFLLILLAVTYVDPLITAVTLGFLVPWTILQIYITGWYRTFERRRLSLAELRDSGVLQGVTSFALLKTYGRTRWELLRHAERSVSTQRVAIQHWLTWWWFDMAVVRLIPYLRNAVAAFYFGRKVILGEMTLGMTVPMLAYLNRLSEPIIALVNWINSLRMAAVPMERVMQTLEVESSVPIAAHPVRLEAFNGQIEFENVSYAHPGFPNVLSEVTLAVKPGETVAIVGASGAGKSTLANLAVRLYDPLEGRVLVDGVDLKQVDLFGYLQQVATVTQETFVFEGSLAENLRYGKTDATDEEMREVLSQVGLDVWLARLPNGLEQDLESGGALSVGQRQRLGIARALLARPQLMIFDEPTSALDSATEFSVAQTLREVSAGRTVLWVTHRLNTIQHADRIAVLEAGRLVQLGTPAELRNQDGPYRQLLASYFGASAPPEP